MKRSLVIVSFVATFVCSATLAFAQAFGEYGRTLGGVPHGPGITGSRAPGGVTQGSARTGGIGDVGGPPLPSRLLVATRDAGLYPRQAEQSERLCQLAQGQTVIARVDRAGVCGWDM